MSTKEQALKIFEVHYTEWENGKERDRSGYDYERTYLSMSHAASALWRRRDAACAGRGVAERRREGLPE